MPDPSTRHRPTLTWQFPLPRTHTGVLLGNAVQGLMVWGDQSLNITIGRAGFWDHRFGNAFATRTTFAEVRRLLEAGDEAGLRRAFGTDEDKRIAGQRPHQVGGGRLELHLPDGLRPRRAELDTRDATLRVTLGAGGEGESAGGGATLIIRQAIDEELAWIELPEALRGRVRMKLIPSWDHVSEDLSKLGCEPPQRTSRTAADQPLEAFTQPMPEDDPLTVRCLDRGERIAITTALGADGMDRAEGAAAQADTVAAAERAARWWDAYWAEVPAVNLPDPDLQFIFDYGVYKQAGLTAPHGLACTLQGPWIEEYRLPPWSCDYHFNINIQMIYWPCLPTNRASHFSPLWRLIESWRPQLTQNAEKFFGTEAALMLPHAVDDRCQVVGAFWTGTIDQACTAWMAQIAWHHYRYTMDESVLRDVAWPLLAGAFNGFFAMMEWVQQKDGQWRLSLPVSVSPEFKGSRMDAWGRDASFQLAAVHCIAHILNEAADILGYEQDKRWQQVLDHLPQYTTVTGPATAEAPERQHTRIALWDGMDLLESHRHHSHLGAIYPFRTVDPADGRHAEVIRHSLHHWVRQGTGAWSGWCVPWAAIIHARCDNADGAVSLLHLWRDNFTNEGHGTLHDAAHPGLTTLAPSLAPGGREAFEKREVMQAEAGMGALMAVCELLVQCRDGIIHVLPTIPRRWRELSFCGIAAEGGFLIDATVNEGCACSIRITSPHGGRLQLAHHMGEACRVDGHAIDSPIIDMTTEPGQVIEVQRP